MLYRAEKDPTKKSQFLQQARDMTDGLRILADYTGTHDLGFMVGLPMWLAAESDPDPTLRGEYASVIVNAAESLATRWNPNVQAFQSGVYEGQWGTIIDSAVNASFLIEAGKLLGGTRGDYLTAVGTQHLRTLATHFVRSDGSTIHRLTFDPATGSLTGATPGQGLDASSTWTRGQAWAIFGFAKAYQLTGEQDFRDVATRTAEYWVQHTPGSCVPKWDYDDPALDAPLDSSAAAIAALGMLTLTSSDSHDLSHAQYRDAALATFGVLADPDWVQPNSPNPGVLQRQSHAVPAIRQEGSYVWGDAYLLYGLLPLIPNSGALAVPAFPTAAPLPSTTNALTIRKASRLKGPKRKKRVDLAGTTTNVSESVRIYRRTGSGTGALRIATTRSKQHVWKIRNAKLRTSKTTHFFAVVDTSHSKLLRVIRPRK